MNPSMYTVAALVAILGTERYEYKETSNGVQVNLHLKAYDGDLEKVQGLLDAWEKLKAAGYTLDKKAFSVASRPLDANGRPVKNSREAWKSWLCIWVGPPRVDDTPVKSVVPSLDEIQRFMAANPTVSLAEIREMYGMGVSSQPAKTTTGASTPVASNTDEVESPL